MIYNVIYLLKYSKVVPITCIVYHANKTPAEAFTHTYMLENEDIYALWCNRQESGSKRGILHCNIVDLRSVLVSFENVIETHNSLIIVLSSNKLSQHFITTGSVVILIMQSAHATRLLISYNL